jgi:signal recognition particle subunit SRP68
MDITAFIVASRNSALLYGDYSTYHQQLSRRILKCRQKLGITTKPRAKYGKKPDVNARDVQKDVGCVEDTISILIKTTH